MPDTGKKKSEIFVAGWRDLSKQSLQRPFSPSAQLEFRTTRCGCLHKVGKNSITLLKYIVIRTAANFDVSDSFFLFYLLINISIPKEYIGVDLLGVNEAQLL